MKLAPIALFVYNRPWHTKQTIEALKKNTLASESDLIIFSDGPKESPESKKSVSDLREYLKTITGFHSVRIVYRKQNYGLAKSIISGVSEIVSESGKVIVLEDDLVSSLFFLKYMNDALDLYAKEEKVISIHGYIYPVKKKLPETFFLKGADCWGWATWKRGWDLFETDGLKLLKELKAKNLTYEFNFSDSYQYARMLADQTSGKNNSWAILWYASAFLKDKVTLYPGRSLVNNIGLDGSGTNCGKEEYFNTTDSMENIKIEVSRVPIEDNPRARAAVIEYFRSQNSLWARGVRFLKGFFK